MRRPRIKPCRYLVATAVYKLGEEGHLNIIFLVIIDHNDSSFCGKKMKNERKIEFHIKEIYPLSQQKLSIGIVTKF